MTSEEWRTVSDYPAYEVSNLGRIRSSIDLPYRSVSMDVALEIRGKFTGEKGQVAALAREYGLPIWTASRIIRGDTYKAKPRLLKTVLSGNGYRTVAVRVRTLEAKVHYVHRLVAAAFVPVPMGLENPVVNHIDGNPLNNRAVNLEWCTQTDNVRHAIKTGAWDQMAASRKGNAKWKQMCAERKKKAA